MPREKKKRHLIVTAGPTYEPIDPVRGITNLSTGLMGYEVAGAALKRGFKVTLITGPVSLRPPKGARIIRVKTSGEMKTAVLNGVKRADYLVMAAAVADFKVKKTHGFKIKKEARYSLKLIRTPDILGNVPRAGLKIKAGFALETGNLLENARKKLKDKKLDFIVANKAGERARPFGPGKKTFILLKREGKPVYHKNRTKREMAGIIVDCLG